MADFKYTIDIFFSNCQNEKSSLKKLAKTLYGGRAHFDAVHIHAENIQDNGQHVLGPGSMPKTDQWDTLVDDKHATILRPKSVGKSEAKRRELMGNLIKLMNELNKLDLEGK